MAEAAGLAIGIKTATNNVIDNSTLHLGKLFGADSQDCLPRLDNADSGCRDGAKQLNSQADKNTKSLKDTRISEADMPQAISVRCYRTRTRESHGAVLEP